MSAAEGPMVVGSHAYLISYRPFQAQRRSLNYFLLLLDFPKLDYLHRIHFIQAVETGEEGGGRRLQLW